jgi:hypothetical protein
MLAFALGAYAVVGDETAAAAGAVGTTTILAMKAPLHDCLRRLTWAELRSGLTLLVMSFVLLPVLPDRAIDRWGAINPYELWLMTANDSIRSESALERVPLARHRASEANSLQLFEFARFLVERMIPFARKAR